MDRKIQTILGPFGELSVRFVCVCNKYWVSSTTDKEKKTKQTYDIHTLISTYICRNMLFCSLTNHVIKKDRQSVDEHLKGKKFQRAQGAYFFF